MKDTHSLKARRFLYLLIEEYIIYLGAYALSHPR